MQNVKIHFLGASGTVTGSKYLIETSEKNILIDCGMFQGSKDLENLNWDTLPITVSDIDIVLLTHGHLDHTGYLPRLIGQGYRGPIVGTAPTLALAEIILRDSAKIHEQEAKRINEDHESLEVLAKPFYSLQEAEVTLGFFRSEDLEIWIPISDHIKMRFQYNGHIIGSVFIELDIFSKIFVFSGDIGREEDLLLYPPKRPEYADYIFLESTYGDRLHPKDNAADKLSALIEKTIHNRGNLVIPSFAIERLQTLMFLLWKLYQRNQIPNIPIFIDSPMGNNVLRVFEVFSNWHKISPKEMRALYQRMIIITSYRDTWKTIENTQPKVVIAGSGMVTGGRVLTYLSEMIEKSNTSILLVGYQAEETRGRQLLEGVKEITINGKLLKVKADVEHIESLSAHADQRGLLNWLSDIKNSPKEVFLIHGESAVQEVFKSKISETYGWNVSLPKLYSTKEILLE